MWAWWSIVCLKIDRFEKRVSISRDAVRLSFGRMGKGEDWFLKRIESLCVSRESAQICAPQREGGRLEDSCGRMNEVMVAGQLLHCRPIGG